MEVQLNVLTDVPALECRITRPFLYANADISGCLDLSNTAATVAHSGMLVVSCSDTVEDLDFIFFRFDNDNN